jgi:dUTP pyrophosphatase
MIRSGYVLKIVKVLPNAIIPKYATDGSVAFDLHACDDINLYPGDIRMIHTGLAVEIPNGCEMQIRQRSGLSLKFPNYIAIGVGTIDWDYRGEIMIPIKNNNNLGVFFEIRQGDRIAQAIISPIIQVEIEKVQTLNMLTSTERGDGGFGSTGKE